MHLRMVPVRRDDDIGMMLVAWAVGPFVAILIILAFGGCA